MGAEQAVTEEPVSQYLLKEGHSVLLTFTCSYQPGLRDTTLVLPKEAWFARSGHRAAPEGGWARRVAGRAQSRCATGHRTFPCSGSPQVQGAPPELAPRRWGRKAQLVSLCIQPERQDAGSDSRKSSSLPAQTKIPQDWTILRKAEEY